MPMIDTADLAIHVQEVNPHSAKPVMLLHGWPDDASTWDQVAPVIGEAGFRVIVPTLRGFGDTQLPRRASA